MKFRWTIRHHAIAWLVVCAFALTYLATLIYIGPGDQIARNPDPAARAVNRGRPPGTEPLFGKRKDQDDRVSVRTAKALRSEIVALKKQLADVTAREKDLRQRLAAIESALGPVTASLPPADTKDPKTTGSVPRERKAVALPLRGVTIEFSDLPEDGFGDTRFNTSPLPVQGAAAATKTLFGVELASGKSPDALHKQWATLGAQHKSLLGGLQARHAEVEAADVESASEVRLIAGPFPNAADAALLCARLQAAGTECRQAVFAGDPFQ